MMRFFHCIGLAIATLSMPSLTLADANLRESLHLQLKAGHKAKGYSEARGILERVHVDPQNSEHIILFYSGRSQDADLWVNQNGRDGWNREHLWPQSRGMGQHPMKSDLHNLMPTDASINQDRGNLNFDNGGSPQGEAPGTFLDGNSFEPRDSVKGDVARALFYVDVRYEGTGGEPDLELVDESSASGGQTLGDLCTLLDWHVADPVSAEELTRNDLIEIEQGNRNVFVDQPELAIQLYGTVCGIEAEQEFEDHIGEGKMVGRLRIGTWNIANLHHESGVALRGGSEARDDIDYERLAELADALKLDIVALQEIGSPAAARRVFPEESYHVIMSGRYISGSENGEQRDIYTAMVFAKSTFPQAPATTTFPALSIAHVGFDRDGTASVRPTRAAMITELMIAGENVKIMGVHLKSSCHRWSLDPVTDQSPSDGRPFSSRYHCRTLAAQGAVLENWMEQQADLGISTVVLGDFNRQLNSMDDTGMANDDFWLDLNDGMPNGLSVSKGPVGFDDVCWPNHSERFRDHIDFIIYNDLLEDHVIVAPPEKHSMGHEDNDRYADRARQKLSDHCPVVTELKW